MAGLCAELLQKGGEVPAVQPAGTEGRRLRQLSFFFRSVRGAWRLARILFRFAAAAAATIEEPAATISRPSSFREKTEPDAPARAVSGGVMCFFRSPQQILDSLRTGPGAAAGKFGDD